MFRITNLRLGNTYHQVAMDHCHVLAVSNLYHANTTSIVNINGGNAPNCYSFSMTCRRMSWRECCRRVGARSLKSNDCEFVALEYTHLSLSWFALFVLLLPKAPEAHARATLLWLSSAPCCPRQWWRIGWSIDELAKRRKRNLRFFRVFFPQVA